MFKKVFRRNLIILTLLTLGAVNAVLGCTQQPPQPPPAWVIRTGWIQPYPCGPKYQLVWILFHNYTTFGAASGQFCACALNLGGPIASIVGARLLDADTGLGIAGFDFCANENAGISASTRVRGGNFQGFLSLVTQDVPTGIRADLMVCVLLKKTATVQQLAAQLQKNGILVTGEADETGNFNSTDHFGSTGIGDVEEGSFELLPVPPKGVGTPLERVLQEEDTEL